LNIVTFSRQILLNILSNCSTKNITFYLKNEVDLEISETVPLNKKFIHYIIIIYTHTSTHAYNDSLKVATFVYNNFLYNI